jgi:hypothetical protein
MNEKKSLKFCFLLLGKDKNLDLLLGIDTWCIGPPRRHRRIGTAPSARADLRRCGRSSTPSPWRRPWTHAIFMMYIQYKTHFLLKEIPTLLF